MPAVLSGYTAYRIPKINMIIVLIHMEKMGSLLHFWFSWW
jgi:hypothetical protein